MLLYHHQLVCLQVNDYPSDQALLKDFWHDGCKTHRLLQLPLSPPLFTVMTLDTSRSAVSRPSTSEGLHQVLRQWLYYLWVAPFRLCRLRSVHLPQAVAHLLLCNWLTRQPRVACCLSLCWLIPPVFCLGNCQRKSVVVWMPVDQIYYSFLFHRRAFESIFRLHINVICFRVALAAPAMPSS